jgi:tetratricopeptide (TPR) repeat protein
LQVLLLFGLNFLMRSPTSPQMVTFPFWLTLCLLLSLGTVGVLGTVPAFGQGRKQNAEQKLLHRKDADRHVARAQQAQQMGQLETAVFHWHQAAAIYRHLKDWPQLNLVFTALAELHLTQNNVLAAEAVLRQQLHLARERQDHATQITTLQHLGELLIKQGQAHIAQAIFADAQAIALMNLDPPAKIPNS